MAKLAQFKYLIIAAILALLMITGSAYFFAEKKSEPKYLSKIDRLMFDTDNQSPKFVITLPDKQKKIVKEALKAPAETVTTDYPKNEETPTIAEEAKEPSLDEILINMPSIYGLAEIAPTQVLKHIALDDNLVEKKGKMLLPKIAQNGRKPWVEYGKSIRVQPMFKRVAVVIKGLGFDSMALDKINKGTASEVSLSFSPYAPERGTKILPARQQGHETYMDLLLSSPDFLKSDSGPLSISLTISPEESKERLLETIAAGAPVGGVIVNDGVADDSNAEILKELMQELKDRGLLMIDATTGPGLEEIQVPGLARQKADVLIENLLDKNLIQNELQKAEETAFRQGQVLVVVEPKPVIIKELLNWINTFSAQPQNYEEVKTAEISKPLALVPVSNLVVE